MCKANSHTYVSEAAVSAEAADADVAGYEALTFDLLLTVTPSFFLRLAYMFFINK